MFKGGQTIGLDTGAMRIKTRLFNEELLDAQAHLNRDETDLMGGSQYKKSNNMQSMDASDLEDIRLNKLRVM